MNKKPTILAVAALGSLALIGTGFAGWVIVANATQTVSGNITAYEVADNRLVLSGQKWDGEDTASGSIIFGKPTTYNPSTEWFQAQGDDETMKKEKLFATYTVTVKSKNENDKAALTIWASDWKLGGTENAQTAYNTAIANNYIAEPTLKIVDSGTEDLLKVGKDGGESKTIAEKDGLTLSFKIEFNWGKHFKVDESAVNPFEFYKSKKIDEKVISSEGSSETWGDDASKVMSTLSGISGVTFSFTLHFDRAAA